MIKLKKCFTVSLQRNQNVPMHDHPELELVYFLQGRGRTTVNATTSEIRNHCFTVIPSGVMHDQINLTDVTSLCLKVRGSGLEDFHGAWIDQGGLLAGTLRRFLQETTQRRPFYQELCRGLLEEIVGLTKRVVLENHRKTTKDQLVARAIDFIRDQEGMVSVSELADRFCVSRDYLRHLFQEYTQEPPIRHIIDARIEKAKGLLTNGELSVTEIAGLCGFDDVFYFSRLFKKNTSFPPGRYRTEKCK
jgi:AraC-like DNA-binding protein